MVRGFATDRASFLSRAGVPRTVVRALLALQQVQFPHPVVERRAVDWARFYAGP